MIRADYQISASGMPKFSGQSGANCPVMRHCPAGNETLFLEKRAIGMNFKGNTTDFRLAPSMLEPSCMTNKNSLYAILVTVVFAGILAKLREAMDKQAPMGYQDENGFHLGAEPAEKSKDWRSAY